MRRGRPTRLGSNRARSPLCSTSFRVLAPGSPAAQSNDDACCASRSLVSSGPSWRWKPSIQVSRPRPRRLVMSLVRDCSTPPSLSGCKRCSCAAWQPSKARSISWEPRKSSARRSRGQLRGAAAALEHDQERAPRRWLPSRVVQIYFLVMVVGAPLSILVVAMVGSYFYRGGNEEILDWKLTRSPEREAELQLSDVDQMLAAQNRYRRQRGAPERSLEEVSERAQASLTPDGDALWWPDRT